MSIEERITSPIYEEPEDHELRFRRRANKVGRQTLLNKSYRIMRTNIDEAGDVEIVFEPKQEGVLRYPPIQIELPRDPASTDDYLNFGDINRLAP
jgi:hypothetical protein